MADSDDKTQDGAHKKTLTLKGGPSAGARPGMSRGGRRTVVVERKNRGVPHGTPSPPPPPARGRAGAGGGGPPAGGGGGPPPPGRGSPPPPGGPGPAVSRKTRAA